MIVCLRTMHKITIVFFYPSYKIVAVTKNRTWGQTVAFGAISKTVRFSQILTQNNCQHDKIYLCQNFCEYPLADFGVVAIFSSPGEKDHVSYCHYLVAVVVSVVLG